MDSMTRVETNFEVDGISGPDVKSESDVLPGADSRPESEVPGGPDSAIESESTTGADTRTESGNLVGPSAYIDVHTQILGVLAAQWTDTAQMRKASNQRELPSTITEAWQVAENRTAEAVKRALREHPLWPWLSEFRGLGGVHTARVMARIRDPRRFPGQQCENGHTLVPRYEIGSPCPITSVDGEACGGLMLPPRETTGVRSLWHYCGLHVVDGRSPRKAKGQRATWDMISRTSILQPDGIADAIIKNRTPHYRDIYDVAKARLQATRAAVTDASVDEPGPEIESENVQEDGAGSNGEIVSAPGPKPVAATESDGLTGLRPIQIHERARKIAVKAFIADLLMEWKRISR